MSPMRITRWAIFSDIHSNLEALEAVLADIEALNIPGKLCLGDVVGYNANPAECVEKIRALGLPVIQGNHDAMVAEENEAVLYEFNPVARQGLLYSRRQLSKEQKMWLQQLPLVYRSDEFGAVHASLSVPELWEYVLSTMEAHAHFMAQDRPVFFCGHSHFPAVFTRHRRRNSVEMMEPRPDELELNPEYDYLINVGSVGQPRDNDSRACYGILDLQKRTFEYRRVTYDVEKAANKVLQAGLYEVTAIRLMRGI